MKNRNTDIKNKDILNLIQDLQRCLLLFINDMRGRFHIKYRMTFLYNGAFTLIELLIVVLIIGILVAIAVPQYQKAVEKAAAAEALPILDSVYKAAQTYYLANGDWPTRFNQLDVELPWTGTEKWRNISNARDTRSNDKWSLQIYREIHSNSLQFHSIYLGRISGKYDGSGFTINLQNGVFRCVEKQSDGHVFNGNPGDYCVKLFGAKTPPIRYTSGRFYTMP